MEKLYKLDIQIDGNKGTFHAIYKDWHTYDECLEIRHSIMDMIRGAKAEVTEKLEKICGRNFSMVISMRDEEDLEGLKNVLDEEESKGVYRICGIMVDRK